MNIICTCMLNLLKNVDGDLYESIKRSASYRLGDLVPQVRARTSPGAFRDMALLGLCLELSFSVLYCRTQANPPTLTEKELLSCGLRTNVCSLHEMNILCMLNLLKKNCTAVACERTCVPSTKKECPCSSSCDSDRWVRLTVSTSFLLVSAAALQSIG